MFIKMIKLIKKLFCKSDDYFQIKVNCRRSETDKMIYLLLTSKKADYTSIPLDAPISLYDLNNKYDSIITFGNIVGGRLYVGINPFPSIKPDPLNNHYYGWIEFTRTDKDTCVWANLTNVDLVGLPLTIKGTDTLGKPFSLGYKIPIINLQQALAHKYKDSTISCGPYAKIAGPNKKPSAYPSYEPYIDKLAKGNTLFTVIADKPDGYKGNTTFTGKFTDGKIFLSLSNKTDTWYLNRDQFTSTQAYQCGGGKLFWDGQEVNQNWINDDGSPLTDGQILSNSIFRILCVGINEGYLIPGEPNYSYNFPYYAPFTNADWYNDYTSYVHYNSNSYGFPYSDSNLKVQVQAGRNSTIQLNIIPDDKEADYSDIVADNILINGIYQFGVGANSMLGNIKIGNCVYKPSKDSAYGGFLPTINDDWYKIVFDNDGTHYIWIWSPEAGNPKVESGTAFNPAPFWREDNVLVWGAKVSWQQGAVAPVKPPKP